MSLPTIRILVHDIKWNGVGVLLIGAEHYKSLEDVAIALNIPIKELCNQIAMNGAQEGRLFADENSVPLIGTKG